jgi:hypothetical protein
MSHGQFSGSLSPCLAGAALMPKVTTELDRTPDQYSSCAVLDPLRSLDERAAEPEDTEIYRL